jgi:hypothetical protein
VHDLTLSGGARRRRRRQELGARPAHSRTSSDRSTARPPAFRRNPFDAPDFLNSALASGGQRSKAKRFYLRTYEESRIRMVDLMKMNPDAKDIVTFSMHGEETFRRSNP